MLKNAMITALDLIEEGIIFIDQQGVIADINRSGAEQLGVVLSRKAEDYFGRERWELMRQGKEVELPQKLICRTKSIFDGWIVCVKDLSYLYDALTGVYTRTALSEEINRLEQEMRDAKSAAKEKMMIDVIFIDVDGLKRVNDNGGHSEGDKLLRGIADIIKASVRGRDIIGRYGGDEFVVVIPRTQSGVRERVVAQIRRETKLIGASVSIGAVTINATSAIIEDAIEAADNQMYEEKKAKDGRVL